MDYRGQTIYDVFVQPNIPVTDYRTAQTGIEAKDLAAGPSTHRYILFFPSLILCWLTDKALPFTTLLPSYGHCTALDGLTEA